VETFEGPVLKTKGISASDLPNCEGWANVGPSGCGEDWMTVLENAIFRM